MNGRERFLAALNGEKVDRPPVWLMRQAGRYLPGYRDVRSKAGFWDVCHSPELSTKVALEPLKLFPLDAAIVFSDILVIPQALGMGVTFGKGEGPQVERPLRTEADFEVWNRDGLMERLAFLPRAVKHLAAELKGQHGLMGFAGAPWTLFCYAVEGHGSDDFIAPRTMLHANPLLASKALNLMADAAADLLEAQLDAGCDGVQLFDTWGGLLSVDEYRTFIVPALHRITDRLAAKKKATLIFVRGGHHLLPAMRETGVDGISLDWRTPFADARSQFPSAILQGNIDPVLLFSPPEVVRERTRQLLEVMRQTSDFRRCIVNLGHGILPGTPVESVTALAETVASFA